MDFRTSVIDLKDTCIDHSLYVQCLQLRRDLFIANMGWNLFESMGCEYDQYDTPAAIHVVAHAEGQVLGCMRLLRTDNDQGAVTYMILDAHLGRIPNLPSGIMTSEVRSKDVWEASRLAISPALPTKYRNTLLLQLIQRAVTHTEQQGAKSLLGLMNPAFERIFKRNGIDAYKFGPVLEQRDGRICVLRLDYAPSLALASI